MPSQSPEKPNALDASLLEELLTIGKSINSEINLERLVQRVTDIGTEISGAQFGAFFYNVINQKGESYVLYTISGVEREAFSKFPMPRNTDIFHPTFAGLGTVRYADVTAESHYGRMGPHYGMPKGHLPVRSYLATPVRSAATGEVIGGLFFGHPEAGVFTERSEQLIEGVAGQAAIAMDNARLFEEKKHIEARLREQTDQYRSIFDSTTDAMIILNEEGCVAALNQAATELYDEEASKLINQNAAALFVSSDQLYNAVASILKSGRRYKGIGHVRRGEMDIEVSITGTQYQHQGQKHLLLVLQRIETEREMKHALIRSEAFAETIASVSPVSLWMTNSAGEVVYMNPTWAELVGGRYQDQLGGGWLQSVVPEDREQARSAFAKSFNARLIFDLDFRIRRRDGETRWCSAFGSPYHLPDGAFGGYAGSITDITERKETEARLYSQNTLINTITNNTRQALFLMDDQQRCTYMNPAAEALIGYRLEDVQGQPLHYYIHHTHPDGRHFPIEECPIDRALPTRMQTTGEETFIRKDGTFFPVSFVASPIVENGVPIGTVIEVRDTTEEKKLQQLLRDKDRLAMEMLEEKVRERTAELEKTNDELIQFTSVASHDLKEPARKVAIFSQRAKAKAKDVSDPQFHEYIDNVIRTSKRMTVLIDDLLAFARLSEPISVRLAVDLNTLIQQILDDLQLTISEKGAVIKIEHLPVVEGIELQLGQVFQNLIQNSLKFADPNRAPEIKISAREDGAYFRFDYEDNGIGFDNGMAMKIFDIFERLHSRGQYEGTGIGLAIVKKIIVLHGGRIEAEGTPGKGAHFHIWLPKSRKLS